MEATFWRIPPNIVPLTVEFVADAAAPVSVEFVAVRTLEK